MRTLAAAAILLCGCAAPAPAPPRPAPPAAPAPARGEEGARPAADPDPHGSVEGFLASHFSRRALDGVAGEGYLRSPAPILPASLAVAALAARPWDRRIERREAGRWGDRPRIGDVGLGVLVAGSAAVGLLAPGEGRTARDELFSEAEAYALSLGTATLLKVAVDRRRPAGGSHSFPSGHATGAFTAAELLRRNSGPALGIPAYAVAAAVAFSRVEAGRHYPSDVLAGAALGVLSAGIVDSLHFGSGRGDRGICGPAVVPWVALRRRGFVVGVLVEF